VAFVNVPLAAAVALVSTRQATTKTPVVPPELVASVKTVLQQVAVLPHPPVGTEAAVVEPLRYAKAYSTAQTAAELGVQLVVPEQEPTWAMAA
jgi:hypothetical protein